MYSEQKLHCTPSVEIKTVLNHGNMIIIALEVSPAEFVPPFSWRASSASYAHNRKSNLKNRFLVVEENNPIA